MDTLIPGLVFLVEKHLSHIDDVLCLYKQHIEVKNSKEAVRTVNWKAILYYLQIGEFITRMYKAACEIGNEQLMNLFYNINLDQLSEKGLDPISFELYGDAAEDYYGNYGQFHWDTATVRYLAKGGHYDLLDKYLTIIMKKLHQDLIDRTLIEASILSGLIIRGDVDLILSCKYGDYKTLMKRKRCSYLLYKHRRTEILDKIDTSSLKVHGCVEGKIRAGDKVDIHSDEFRKYLRELNGETLFKYGTYEDIFSILGMGIKLQIGHLFELSSRNDFDLIEKCISLGYTNIENVLDAAIKTDNLALFKRYITRTKVDQFGLVRIWADACPRVFQYVLDLDPTRVIDFMNKKGNYYKRTTANILKREYRNGRKIINFSGFEICGVDAEDVFT